MHHFPKNIVCETSTVHDGNMSFESGTVAEVTHNRKQFLEKNGASLTTYIPIRCNHEDTIVALTHNPRSEDTAEPEKGVVAEVVVTQEKNLPVFLLTADCIPLSFFDPVTKTIALAHISRVTLTKELVEKTVHFLNHNYGVSQKNLLACLGPHIRKASYRFPLPLLHSDSYIAPFTHVMNEYAHIDLTGAATHALIQSGVQHTHIAISEIDTGVSTKHFSYYRAKKDGEDTKNRIGTILMMQ
jgi:copper oxidase (laccase) domain-containing protein